MYPLVVKCNVYTIYMFVHVPTIISGTRIKRFFATKVSSISKRPQGLGNIYLRHGAGAKDHWADTFFIALTYWADTFFAVLSHGTDTVFAAKENIFNDKITVAAIFYTEIADIH